MMNPLADLDTSPTHVEFDHEVSSRTVSLEEREMMFYRRPDITGRQLFFQPRRGEDAAKSDLTVAPPVQLLTLDGQSYFGIPAAPTSSPGDANGGRNETATPTRALRNDGLARVKSIEFADAVICHDLALFSRH